MALPSAVTVAGVTVVLVAGVGLAAAAARTAEKPAADNGAAPSVSTTRTHHRVKPSSPGHRRPAHPGTRHKHSSTDATPRIPTVPVGVYNNSGITGLASDKAAILEAAGWKVATTDNWYGDIPADTVYFPAGLRRDAVRLARTLTISRIRPAVAPMQLDRLTVIFTSS